MLLRRKLFKRGDGIPGELKLWHAVIEQAYKDAVHPVRIDDNRSLKRTQQEAIKWLSEFAPDVYRQVLKEGVKYAL